MLDYHLHCSFSCDSPTAPEEYLALAERAGVGEVCFTDHLDIDFHLPGVEHVNTDFFARDEYLRNMRYRGKTKYKRGMEVGMIPKLSVIDASKELVKRVCPDFVIASVHVLGESEDPYDPAFFDTRTRSQAYGEYIGRALECVREYDEFDSLGHLFFPARSCPFDDPDFRVSDAPELLEALFKHLAERGKALEINTWDFRRTLDRSNYVEAYRRFKELGGEYLTIGSDAHGRDRFAFMLKEGFEMARAAGFKYIAGFDGRKPVLHAI